MRYIILILLFVTLLNAKTFGIVIVDNKKIDYSDSLKPDIESLFETQSRFFDGTNSVDVIIDRDKKIKNIYTRGGVSKLIEYAKSKNFDSLSFIEYKRGSKFLSVLTIVTDEKVQDRRSKSTAFSASLARELPQTILSNVLSLNYELGVLNVKVTY